MEDVLEVYARPYNPARPLVCLDEAAKQLLGEKREPLPATLDHPLRYDNQYIRNGTCAIFMLFQPLAAQRHLQVREQRTALDYAEVVRWMCDELHPTAEKIILVQDNLNTHGPHSLYEAFPPQEARRLSERIEWHFTPLPKGHPRLVAQHGRTGAERFGPSVSPRTYAVQIQPRTPHPSVARTQKPNRFAG